MRICANCICLLLLTGIGSTADEVVTVDRNDKTVVRKGTIADFKGRELTLIVSSREVKIPAASIRRIETEWLPEHEKADELYAKHEYEQALSLYRDVFRNDPRRWVKRRVLANVIQCQANTERTGEACKNFSRLVTDDPHTAYYDAIPLAWEQRRSTESIVNQVRPWLSDSNRTADQLMAASWLLNSAHRDSALRKLRELGRNEWEPIAKLAVSQMWRAELSTLNPSRLDWWQQHVVAVPVELRAGSYYLLGMSLANQGKTDQAILALMRVPMQYPHAFKISNLALLHCGQRLQESGRNDEARRCYQRLLATDSVEKRQAQERLIELAK